MSDTEIARQRQEFELRVQEELRRVTTLDDQFAAQLNNILVAGSLAGILASITFLKDIAPAPVDGSLAYLRAAWVVLLVASACGIFSILSSRLAARWYRDALYCRSKGQDEARAKARCNEWNLRTKVCQFLGLALVFAGAALLLLFANLNLPTGR